MTDTIEYRYSIYPSRFSAYQSKRKSRLGERIGKITIYCSTTWNHSKTFDTFVRDLIHFSLVERICLERAFQKIRLKDRCKTCPPQHIVKNMFWILDNI